MSLAVGIRSAISARSYWVGSPRASGWRGCCEGLPPSVQRLLSWGKPGWCSISELNVEIRSQQQHSLPSCLLSSFCPTRRSKGEARRSLILHGGSPCLPSNSFPQQEEPGPVLAGEQFSCFCHKKIYRHTEGHPAQHPAHNRISTGSFRPGSSKLWRLSKCSGAVSDRS